MDTTTDYFTPLALRVIKLTRINTRKWFPLQGELAPITNMSYFLINNKPKLILSMLGAGIVQVTFGGEAGEAEGGEEETTGGYFYGYFYWYFYRSG